jgi:hypothetical protein
VKFYINLNNFFLIGPSPPYRGNTDKPGYSYTTPSARTYLPPVSGGNPKQKANVYQGALPKL